MKGHRINWRPRELAWIKRRKKTERRALHAAFVKKFRRSEISFGTFKSLCTRAGWLTGRKCGRAPGYSIAYSDAELAFIKRRRTKPRRQAHAEFVAAFPDHAISFKAYAQLCKQKGFLTGRDGRYSKGAVPANKGKKMPFNANSARTQFKKGQLPRNTKHLGHERADKYGYILISVAETNPHTSYERRYVHKHRLLWEQKHGPVPKGMVLKCKGDRSDTDPSNWDLVPRGVLARLNKRPGQRYDNAPAELRPTLMAVAKLQHGLGKRRRQLTAYQRRPESEAP